ncbi:zinc-binding dehydrogenase, partial [Streptomyces aculeolatus]|uniref:zinc-binding dehydrogenase n=1 Tax=Streptomyces aculeolatus TaxID=270689 RepID=UPI001CEC5624
MEWVELPAGGGVVSEGVVSSVSGGGVGSGGVWVVVGSGLVCEGVVGGLVGGGVEVVCFGDVGLLVEAVELGEVVPEVVVWCVEGGSWVGDVGGGVSGVVVEGLGVVQGWLSGVGVGRLVVVTSGGVGVTSGGVDVGVGSGGVGVVGGSAGVVGLVRSVQVEHPGRVVLVDVDVDAVDVDAVVGDGCGGLGLVGVVGVAVGAGEWQVAVRGGVVWVPRLVELGSGGVGVPVGGVWRLEPVGGRGSLEDVVAVDVSGVGFLGGGVLGEGLVRVEVRAAGVNFRDVLIALGEYPGEGVMGAEFAGVVTGVGAGVVGVGVGDRVMGLCEGGFGSVVVTDYRMVVGVPEGWSFERAASVPTVFLTAWYGLADLAGVAAGESVLVHAAAGGVGLAALQLARYWGVEVFATASEAKWGVVEGAGVPRERIASSRDVGFAERFREVSGGRGVDVVLNSLAGEFVDASLGCLGEGGRFVEMGK